MQFRIYLTAVCAALILTGAALASVNNSQPPRIAPAYQAESNPPLRVFAADEDSVYYEYGFEDGWSGWTTRDNTDIGYKWHSTERNAFDGRSWWCGEENLGGYRDRWLQYILTPTLNLQGRQNLALRFRLFYALEDTAGSAPDQSDEDTRGYDGWDGCNVWISTNNGQTWQVIEPVRPRYNFRSMFSFGWMWNMGRGIPGWGGFSNGWLQAEFDISRFAQNNVKIRWAFCSDPAVCTVDSVRLTGMFIDNLEVVAGDQVVWSNNGDAPGDMTFDLPTSGDHWEISDANAHSGRFSAHCPIRRSLDNALITPPILVPGVGWYTWFDFWIRADTKMYNANNDDQLDDLYEVYISADSLNWDRILWDYGRDTTWQDRWHYFGPDSTYNHRIIDLPEWKRRLNLTQFQGRRIWLRWVVRTDTNMTGNQGTGIWLDDVRILMLHRYEHDVGPYYLHIGYPTAMGFSTRCQMAVRNYGMISQPQIVKYWRIANSANYPITPWGSEITPDSIRAYTFLLQPNRIPCAGIFSVYGLTAMVNDQNPSNDLMEVPNVVFYPSGISVLGYDNRTYQYRSNIDRGSGALVYFTPVDDGVRGAFDLKALRVRWNGEQGNAGDVNFRLHIFGDDRGDVGNEIHTQTVPVTRADILPNLQVIDLTEVQVLRNLTTNFWVWFEILRGDHWPQIIYDDKKWGEGHFFIYNGSAKQPFDGDMTVNAVLMPAGASGTNLIAGLERLDFGAIRPGFTRRMETVLFNGNTNPITIERINIDNDLFTLDTSVHTPLTLRMGDYRRLYVDFTPQAEGEALGAMTFTCNDDTPPTVQLAGVGDNEAAAPREARFPLKYNLGAAYPNPFNAVVTIPFSLPRAGAVQLTVHNLNGREVTKVVDGVLSAGNHSIAFNAEGLPAGIYIYRLEAGGFIAAAKMVLVK